MTWPQTWRPASAFLRTRPEIDARRIGLAGVSQAGWIMPIAAQKSRPAFMVLMVGPTVSVGIEGFYSRIVEFSNAPVEEGYKQLPSFNGFHGFDPKPVLESLNVPGLWLLGGEDRSIPTPATVAILDQLIASGKPYARVVFPGFGHNLAERRTGRRSTSGCRKSCRSDVYSAAMKIRLSLGSLLHCSRPRAAAQQPAAPRPATPPVMVGQKDGFFTTKDGIKIHYLTHGDSGSWVVLVHGYSDNAQRMWFNTGIAPEIAKRHRVVAIDNRNHGQSDKPMPGGSGRAQDVVELMDHLKIQRAHIHGYSMGGGIVGIAARDDSRSIHHRGLRRIGHERDQRRRIAPRRKRWTMRCRRRRAPTRRAWIGSDRASPRRGPRAVRRPPPRSRRRPRRQSI